MPRDIATYTTLYFDILNAFDNFGSLFDELFGQGETGTWDEVKQSLKEDPNGPQIDLRKELIQHLGQRVSMLTDYQLPITTTSERLLFAIEAKNAKAVAAAIEKLFKNDPTVKRREVERARHLGDRRGRIAANPDAAGYRPSATSRPVRPCIRSRHKKKKAEDDEDEEETSNRLCCPTRP